MKSYFAIITLLIFVLLSCNKDNKEENLEGKWNLVNATGGIAGFNINYPKGQIIWIFDDGTLSIDNKYAGQLNFSFPSGNYRYFEINPSNLTTLYINDQQFGDIKISNDSLIIDQSSFISDGFKYLYIRN